MAVVKLFRSSWVPGPGRRERPLWFNADHPTAIAAAVNAATLPRPPGARSTEIKLALTLMGAVASGVTWDWPAP